MVIAYQFVGVGPALRHALGPHLGAELNVGLDERLLPETHDPVDLDELHPQLQVQLQVDAVTHVLVTPHEGGRQLGGLVSRRLLLLARQRLLGILAEHVARDVEPVGGQRHGVVVQVVVLTVLQRDLEEVAGLGLVAVVDVAVHVEVVHLVHRQPPVVAHGHGLGHGKPVEVHRVQVHDRAGLPGALRLLTHVAVPLVDER